MRHLNPYTLSWYSISLVRCWKECLSVETLDVHQTQHVPLLFWSIDERSLKDVLQSPSSRLSVIVLNYFYSNVLHHSLCVLKKQTFCLFCSYFSGINVKYHDRWVKCLLKCLFWSFPPFIKAALFLCNLNINASPPEGSPGNGMQLQNGSKKLLTSVVCSEAFPVCNGKGSWHSSC